jgi:hypothetical protein
MKVSETYSAELYWQEGDNFRSVRLYQHLLLTAEKKFWRCVESGEPPSPFGAALQFDGRSHGALRH